jgi:MoaA/NifB/PqqE/SkfB family radical SAM enzyme
MTGERPVSLDDVWLEEPDRSVYLAVMAFRLFKRRPLAAIQVEVTSRCTRRCAICPRSADGLAWREGDLDEATWHRLQEDLDLAPYVHLQGWGEPMLHPRLPEMVASVKAAGPKVGLTTNADRLSEAVDWIVEEGVDLVTVSVAGGEAAHAALRDGSGIGEVWDAIRELSHRRGRRKRPRVQISFLLTRDGVEELPPAVESAAAAGADEFFVIHLDVTPTRELLERAAFEASGPRENVGRAVAAAESAARSRGIAFRPPPLARQDLLVCASDPLRFVFVGWDGRVGPCVNLLLPMEGPIPRWTESGLRHVEPVVYGCLGEMSLGDILRGEAYRRFTDPFASRLAAESEFLNVARSARGAEARSRLDEADDRREREMFANPFPEPCTGCHKALGW